MNRRDLVALIAGGVAVWTGSVEPRQPTCPNEVPVVGFRISAVDHNSRPSREPHSAHSVLQLLTTFLAQSVSAPAHRHHAWNRGYRRHGVGVARAGWRGRGAMPPGSSHLNTA